MFQARSRSTSLPTVLLLALAGGCNVSPGVTASGT